LENEIIVSIEKTRNHGRARTCPGVGVLRRHPVGRRLGGSEEGRP